MREPEVENKGVGRGRGILRIRPCRVPTQAQAYELNGHASPDDYDIPYKPRPEKLMGLQP